MYPWHPLTRADLAPTQKLVAACFPTDIGHRWTLPFAAGESGYTILVRDEQPLLRTGAQWLARDAAGLPIGTFGLYSGDGFEPARDGLIALNWLCLDPRWRGRGLGRALWDSVLREARATGAARLIFYSSTEPHHLDAERLYLHAGCARRPGPFLADGDHRLTFFDLALRPGAGPATPAEAARIDEALTSLAAVDADISLAMRIERRRVTAAAQPLAA